MKLDEFPSPTVALLPNVGRFEAEVLSVPCVKVTVPLKLWLPVSVTPVDALLNVTLLNVVEAAPPMVCGEFPANSTVPDDMVRADPPLLFQLPFRLMVPELLTDPEPSFIKSSVTYRVAPDARVRLMPSLTTFWAESDESITVAERVRVYFLMYDTSERVLKETV